jgi:hypothetical protein
MGDFRIIIDAVGGHGQDRNKKNGEKVDFGSGTPEDVALVLVKALLGSGCSVQSAKVVHWPADNYEGRDPEKQIIDCLLTRVRQGSF